MISGLKKVKLFSPTYFKNLYPNDLGSLGRTVQSRVNLDNPDLVQFPNLKDVICEEGSLYPGDLLFIPGFYWHQVTSVESSISINIFYGDNGENNYIEKLISSRLEVFLYWLINILQQNEALLQKDVFPELHEIIKVFLKYQFKEDANDEQVGILVKHVMQHYNLTELPPFLGNKRKNPKRLKIRGLLFRDK
eukprot:TRINITY_DN12237_c0_g1_i1.p1 TRINITY_DN12237_c0_g1~~TRINITY_DN12237_c0_g1_i1.p1  ORF type:complete len:192 (+),score=40.02 TRINITY_DN12237_c0_g1_i1:563-1138(+)